MHHMDMPMGYHVWDAMLKADQHHAELKDRFLDDTE